MNDLFEVSVVIPAYNEAPRIPRALNSVIRQTCSAAEIILVDDGSTDHTAELVAKFPQVTYIHQENQGLAAARNTGLRAAKYPWIALLDGDDEWLPDHLQNAHSVLSANPEIVWYFAAFERRSEDGRLLYTHQVSPGLAEKHIIHNYFLAEAQTSFSRPSSFIAKKSVFDEAGLFNVDINFYGEDLDMWYRIACRYPQIAYHASPGCIYWEKKGSITTTQANIPRFLRRIEITRNSVPPEDIHPVENGAEFLVQHWVKDAFKSAIKHNDAQSMKKVNAMYSTLLTQPWRFAGKLLKNDILMRIAHQLYAISRGNRVVN